MALFVFLGAVAFAASSGRAEKVWQGKKVPAPPPEGDNRVVLRGFASDRGTLLDSLLERKMPWSLPAKALEPTFLDTIHILVLRFNFQEENPDDPNTTGRGIMNLSRPLDNPVDSALYYDSVGHLVDPPPHDSLFFDAHMRALRRYYETVSEGKITLTWDIYPPSRTGVYQLPHEMSYYGKCSYDSVVYGLERYFIDCIQLVDTVEPGIVFGDYESIFLFHAGSDRQNDIGFPETCSDLFSGFIRFGDSIAVDGGATYVKTALIMPETSNQDNRATALNAVIAHEFGHQLGLVDLYNSRNFMSQLGDFALMDNNGFGTGIDFGFTVGRVFGAIPLFPCAWSRAYLGYVDVYDFRQGSDIRIVAAEIASEGIKIARVPISENEYYLIENRLVDTDGRETAMLLDESTYVFQGPVDLNTREFTGEYDYLMPGSGMLIFHVDEGVAGLDYDGDGMNNFDDNDLQWDPDRKFISLVEADGLVNFGGFYRAGFGKAEDMFRDDRNNAFTPNTNPATIDNSGNNTHIYIINITRDTVLIGGLPTLLDTVMTFDVETDKLAPGFPVRAGAPEFGLSPIADDLDGDGTDEVIVASGKNLLVFTTTGENFLRKVTGCETCPLYYDTSQASVYPAPGRAHPLPLFVRALDNITAGPVTGNFGSGETTKYVAVGFPSPSSGGGSGWVWFYSFDDTDENGQADPASVITLTNAGIPLALSFGEKFYVLTSRGIVFRKDNLGTVGYPIDTLSHELYHGICRVGEALILLAGDSSETVVYYLDSALTDSVVLEGMYSFGPISVDLNRDGAPEIVAVSPDGKIVCVTVDTSMATPSFHVYNERETGFPVTTNPIAGDVDGDGYADIVIGGTNAVYAFNQELILKTDFPLEVSDKYLDDDVIASPVMADIVTSGATSTPEIVFPTYVGNVYSFGLDLSPGFPLSGGELEAGSPVIFSDSTGGKLGYLGADGWFYAWEVEADSVRDYWLMGGHDPAGTFAFDNEKLLSPQPADIDFPRDKFFCYPNPVTDGRVTLRYFLGRAAENVTMNIYDLSGEQVANLSGTTLGGLDNEVVWNCSGVTPGVYRCVITVEFDGKEETAFTDIAVIR